MKWTIDRKEQIVFDEDDPFADIARTERIGLSDFIIAAAIGVAVWMMLSVWNFDIVHPSLWDDLAVASGIRPASHLVGGYFVAFASFLVRTFGGATDTSVLRIMGRVLLTGIAIVVYAALREMLVFIMRARPQRSMRRALVMQIASIVGTFAFVLNEPVWRAGQYLSETTILISLAIFALEFFFLFLRKGTLKYAYLCTIAIGLLAAESVAAFVFLVAFLAINNLVLRIFPVFESPFFRPAVMAVNKWYLSFALLLAILFGVGVNVTSFVLNEGLDVLHEQYSALPLLYISTYVARVTSATTPFGWVMWTAFCMAPFIVAIIRFPAAADEETFLPYATGLIFFVCAVVAVSQMMPVPAIWFWSHCPVQSDFLLSMGLLFLATTIAAAVTIMGVDSLCRNHARLAAFLVGEEDEEEEEEAAGEARRRALARKTREEMAERGDELTSPLARYFRLAIVVIVPLLIIVVMLPSRLETKSRAMLRVVKAVLEETVREAGDADFLFTDGNLDVGYELESFFQGGHLRCLPLVSRTAGSARDIYMRTKCMRGSAEDLFSFRIDVGMGLRSWIRDRPEKLKKAAVQMGFDLWKRDGKAMPPFGGLLSRPAGWPSEAERVASIEAAYRLIDRLLAVQCMGGKVMDVSIKSAFMSAQWRLSRMCTYRSEEADRRGDVKTAKGDADRAATLNACNETYAQVLDAMNRHSERAQRRLTVREGLQLALVRADFAMGRPYAEIILNSDPDDFDANFAMGMAYVKERQFTRAADYLRRCLIRRPKEPSIYNNLAMIALETGDLVAAERDAKKALALMPDSASIQDTMQAIRKAREAKAK